MAFNAIRPMHMTDAIVKAFVGDKAGETAVGARPAGNWMQQKQQMLHWFSLFGKKKK